MIKPLTTTLNAIRAHGPCENGWKKLLVHLGKTKADDEPLPFETILDSNGLDDALWCCRAAPEYDREWRLFAVWCARQVEHLMTDSRSKAALQVAERYANGKATNEELAAAARAAANAARAAARAAANAARAAARAAANAARAAANAAWAERTAADADAAWAAWAAADEARAPGAARARARARDAQTARFRAVVRGEV